MIFDDNFIDFINILSSRQVKFVLVGGMAVVIHGVTRTTKDMDIFYEGSRENCERVLEAVNEFGFGFLKFTVDDLMDKTSYIQLGHEPVRIDLFCELPGISFEEVFDASSIYEEEDFKIRVIHINHLIQNKKEVGRQQDLLDVKKLEKILKKRNNEK
jgi:predicted nucleotidyltransferase